MDSELQAPESDSIAIGPPVCRRHYRHRATWRQRSNIMDQRNHDRRTHRRYDIHLPVQYRVSQRNTMPIVGTGTTCDLSTGGLSFRCRRILPVGAHIELSVEWPAMYGDSQAMELQVTGFVMRTEGNRTGVRVNSHRFRMLPLADQPYRVSA
ncbi:MAG: PilZ domain-containing protein [Bryobacteraceae bacterium]